jgi:hypothetical protein
MMFIELQMVVDNGMEITIVGGGENMACCYYACDIHIIGY